MANQASKQIYTWVTFTSCALPWATKIDGDSVVIVRLDLIESISVASIYEVAREMTWGDEMENSQFQDWLREEEGKQTPPLPGVTTVHIVSHGERLASDLGYYLIQETPEEALSIIQTAQRKAAAVIE